MLWSLVVEVSFVLHMECLADTETRIELSDASNAKRSRRRGRGRSPAPSLGHAWQGIAHSAGYAEKHTQSKHTLGNGSTGRATVACRVHGTSAVVELALAQLRRQQRLFVGTELRRGPLPLGGRRTRRPSKIVGVCFLS